MEILRKRIIFILVTVLTVVKSEEIKVENVTPKSNKTPNICPFTKIFEDIFKIHNKSSDTGIYIENMERAKIFLSTIAKVTEEEKNPKQTTEEQLVNHIIESIKKINSNTTKNNPEDSKMDEAIILKSPNSNLNKTTETGNKSNLEIKINHPLQPPNDTSPEDTRYVEILTIEPNNTSTNHNIIEALKHLMPSFNTTTTKDIHNITVIDKHRNKTQFVVTPKNVSAIIVTYCDKENLTKMNETIHPDIETDIKSNENPKQNQEALNDLIEHENEEMFRPDGNLTVEEKKDILEAAEYGMQKMHELYSVLEPKLYSMGMWLDETNPARYVAAFSAPTEDVARYSRYGYASLQAAERLKQLTSDGDGVESREEIQFPSANALRQSGLLQHCPLRGIPKCPPASKRYRTHDGTCNNFNRPRWGSTMTPVQRFLFPSYADDIQAPRISVTGSKLPSAREISASIHESKSVESPGITHLLMQWGQFVDHDITSTSQSRGFNGSVPRCCKNGGRDFVPKDLLHPECMPITVPTTDPFYGRLGVRCLDFVRSSPAPRDDCSLGWREQLNQVSAYIDGSPLYASSARQSDKLRLFRNGMLQYGRVQQRRPILPSSPERKDELCRGGAVSTDCFKSGDARVNEHPGLVAAHIVWLRQHNRMAQELAHLNPSWSDEKIYQETRKIVGAMIQHITYKEFLPIVLGTEVMRLFDLELLKKGYHKGYNPKINASPASSFGSAAFRFGHSLVQSSMMRFDRFHRPMHNNVSLHDELTNPTNIWSVGAVDRLILGMVNQPIQKRDEFITKELTQHLFQTPQFGFGMDLAAINIQRGRDHGVASYTAWREPCGLSAIESYEDLFRVMPQRAAKRIKSIYKHVDDIDLFTGGMAERPVVGGLVGPTFACIIAQQFSNLRNGDRFWYENGGFESSFTPAQLQQIRRTSLAHVLCKTLDTIDDIQPFVFLAANDDDNERISCSNRLLNNFDLSPWVELDSESNNDINRIEDRIESATNKPIKTRPTTTESPQTTSKEMFELLAESSNTTPHKKPHPVAHKPTFTNKIKNKDNIKPIADNTLTKTNETVEIDDKLDFRFGKNKSKRYENSEIPSSRRNNYKKPTTYNDNDDDNIQSIQSVVINNLKQKRPYNRPVIAVTENIDKFTYLINYVPRPTQSWRQTTKRSTYDNKDDGDVVKVTYQTYDDTYRPHKRPNQQQNYYNEHNDDRLDNAYYRNKNPDLQRTTYYDTLPSSARSNDDTFTSSAPKTDDEFTSTTPNIYKLVTFGYVGTYKHDNDDNLKLNTDKFNDKQLSKDFSTHENDDDIKDKVVSIIDERFANDYVTNRQPTNKTDIVDRNNFDSKHLSTTNNKDKYFNDTTVTDMTRQTDYKNSIPRNQTVLTKDITTSDKTVAESIDETFKLSTFYHYDTATKPYNSARPTRRNDEIDKVTTKKKYYYDNNVLHRYIDNDLTVTDKRDNTIKFYDSAKPGYNIEERASVEKLAFLDESESKSGSIKLKKGSPKPAKTPSVSFEIIPSENNPSRWAVFDEREELPESVEYKMPLITEDPYALRELPKPINFSLKKQRPALRG